MFRFLEVFYTCGSATFEDVKTAIHANQHIITTFETDATCFILKTIPWHLEEAKINQLLAAYEFNVPIIVYGKWANDQTAFTKGKQLLALGFKNVKIYHGGFFEWILLQDIYGNVEFPTTCKVVDILRYARRLQGQNVII